MNPSRTSRSIIPHITSLESGTRIGRNIGGEIPPSNTGSFGIFDIRMLYSSNRRALCQGEAKSDSKKSGDNSIFEIAKHGNNFEVEKLVAKFCNFESTNSINTESNNVDLNHNDLNQ